MLYDKRVPWLTIGPDPYVATCQRCGEHVLNPTRDELTGQTWPDVRLTDLIKIFDAAIEEHSKCEQQRFNNVMVRFECGSEDRVSQEFGPYEYAQLTYDALRVDDGEDIALFHVTGNEDPRWVSHLTPDQWWSDVVIYSYWPGLTKEDITVLEIARYALRFRPEDVGHALDLSDHYLVSLREKLERRLARSR